MKKITLVLSALMLCAVINAQQFVATLVHEGNVRIFYGANGFVEAHNAAVSGDVINLSAGLFNSCDITKNITLRGAGWKGAESTTINGYVRLRIPSNDTVSRLYIEGIYFGSYLYVDSVLNAPSIVRCRIDYLNVHNTFNGSIVNCVVDGCGNRNISSSKPANITFVNSILYGFVTNYGFEVINSVVINNSYYSHANFTNCIFYNSTSGYYPENTCSAHNCVYCGSYPYFFNYAYGTGNVSVGSSLGSLFEDPSNISIAGFNENTSFVLTQTAKTQYLGDDGTEVGIYGGFVPFSEQPSFPRITKMQVGKKTTADGKLSVDIEVTSAE